MKRRLKWFLVLFGTFVVLCILTFTLGTGSTAKNRAIARDLLQLARHWDEIDTNLPELLRSLTNLPFRDDAGGTLERLYIDRQYNLMGVPLWEYYDIQPTRGNSSEWTLYHEWEWARHRQLASYKLLTVNLTNNIDGLIFQRVRFGMRREYVEILLGPPVLRVGEQDYYGSVPQREGFESPQAPRSVVLDYDSNNVIRTKTLYFRMDGQPRCRRERLDSAAEE